MFNIFLRGHLLTKKFFTFLIGSTIFTNKNKFLSTYDNINREDYKLRNSSLIFKKFKENIKNLTPNEKFFSNWSNKKYFYNVDYKFCINFLQQNLEISFNTILSYLRIFRKPSIMKCEIPKLKKPYLGCSIRANEENTPGMKIIMIKSDSPAEKAGLKVRDIIVEIDGKPIRSINEYNAAIGMEANTKKIKIFRIENGKENFLNVEVDFIYSD